MITQWNGIVNVMTFKKNVANDSDDDCVNKDGEDFDDIILLKLPKRIMGEQTKLKIDFLGHLICILNFIFLSMHGTNAVDHIVVLNSKTLAKL